MTAKGCKLGLKMTPLLAAMLLCLWSTARPASTEQPGAAQQMAQLREAWLSGDSNEAAARLDAMREDERLGGELPRWLAGMRAWLALEQGDVTTAVDCLKGPLEKANDAREYVRAARLLLLFGELDAALEITLEGAGREPRSIALKRVHAGLLWLSGKHQEALVVYTDIVESSKHLRYPWVAPDRTRWADATPWNEPAPAEGAPPALKEPHAGLFTPLHWFPSDLPGLDRCLAELAADETQVAAMRETLADALNAARQARNRLNTLRTGDAEERARVEQAVRRAEFTASCNARVVASALLNAARHEEAEPLLLDALDALPNDIALLDLYAQALAFAGKAEESRSGPLSRLRALTELSLEHSAAFDPGPAGQAADRVFGAALKLHSLNPETARAQFNRLARDFGVANRNLRLPADMLGLWLYRHGETGLARRYLHQASRGIGYQSGRPMSPDGQRVELALLALGASAAAEAEPEEAAEAPAQPGPPPEDEIEAVDVGDVDREAHPLLRVAPRAGALSASLMDTRLLVYRINGAGIHTSQYGARPLWESLPLLPRAEQTLMQNVYELPARIAREVPANELHALLAPESRESEHAALTLSSFGESLHSLLGSPDYRTRNAINQQAEPLIGVLEARSILLRARLIKDSPQDMAELAAWLTRHQPGIDLRRAAHATSSESYVRMARERREAGVPEVVHSGLLLQGAMLLHDAGKSLDAARLIWHNRDVALGLNAREPLAFVASVLAGKGGDEALRARCLMLALTGPSARELSRPGDAMLPVLELPYTLSLLREIGSDADVQRYLELLIFPHADSAVIARLQAHGPGLLTTPARQAVSSLFASTLEYGSCARLRMDWLKLVRTPGSERANRRLVAWALVSDFPISAETGRSAGSTDAADTVLGWVMLLHTLDHEANPAESARLQELIQRCAGPTAELVAYHPRLFDEEK